MCKVKNLPNQVIIWKTFAKVFYQIKKGKTSENISYKRSRKNHTTHLKKRSMKNSPNHQGLILVSFPKIKRFKLHPMQAKLN
jgi:hypothetical protein